MSMIQFIEATAAASIAGSHLHIYAGADKMARGRILPSK